MNRGILATCYARPTAAASQDVVTEALTAAYGGEPFVVVTDEPPSTKATLGSNSAHITARHDPRTDWVVSLCALDNLVKGLPGRQSSVPTSSAAWTRPRAPHPRPGAMSEKR